MASLFIGFSNVYATDGQGQEKVYILYRDSNGEMVTSIYDPMLFTLKTGHVAFYIVPAEGEPYIVDAMPNIGVKHRTLHDFQGDGKQLWTFDPGLTPEQTHALILWVNGQIGSKYSIFNFKGPDTYDCVGLVEAALESLIKPGMTREERERLNLTPDDEEKINGIGVKP